MNSRKWLPLLMCITILVIAAFQVYWIVDNYEREKKTMQIKAGVAFRETIRQLQTKNLRLPGLKDKAGVEPRQIIVRQDLKKNLPGGGAQVITMVNSLRSSYGKDSTRAFIFASDSPHNFTTGKLALKSLNDSGAFDFLLRLDAIQDTLRSELITQALQKRMSADGLNFPFYISRTKGDIENELTDVAVGFANPVTYHLNFGNYFPHLLRKILWPILFSLLLVAVTLISFVLMYRNILRQQKLAEIKNDFISNITHELKTPIATVGVAIEAMKNFNVIENPAKTKEYLDISSNELQRLGLLVDNVLKISLFEKKQLVLVKDPVNIDQLIREVLGTMELQFSKYEAVVNFHSAVPDAVIQGDRLHLLSVFYNLLDNALKYKKEKPLIDIQLEKKGGNISVTLKDNGIGIDSSYQSRIFEKFFRVPGESHEVKGYGLGLSYVSHIVEQHNGTISVTSEPGRGSMFTLIFPA